MINTLTYGLFIDLIVACIVGLVIKVGLAMAIVITFVGLILIPSELYAILLGMKAVSIQINLLEWLFRFWPVTLFIGMIALNCSQSSSKSELTEETPCK